MSPLIVLLTFVIAACLLAARVYGPARGQRFLAQTVLSVLRDALLASSSVELGWAYLPLGLIAFLNLAWSQQANPELPLPTRWLAPVVAFGVPVCAMLGLAAAACGLAVVGFLVICFMFGKRLPVAA